MHVGIFCGLRKCLLMNYAFLVIIPGMKFGALNYIDKDNEVQQPHAPSTPPSRKLKICCLFFIFQLSGHLQFKLTFFGLQEINNDVVKAFLCCESSPCFCMPMLCVYAILASF